MIDQESMNRLITSGLKSVTGCEVVKSNIANAPIPPYPYISFTIIRTETGKGTYSDAMVRDISLCTRPGALQYREIRTMMRSTLPYWQKTGWKRQAESI